MFQRLFNWIKFKTLPPSVLFKNRLYVERDSKTRRITHNLGLTFRNSKWADYSRYDVQPNLRTRLVHSFFWTNGLMLIVLGFWLTSTSYNSFNLINPLAYWCWVIKDLSAYYILTGSTLLTTTVSAIFTQQEVRPNYRKTQEPVSLKSGDIKYFYYAWLVTNPTPNTSFDPPLT